MNSFNHYSLGSVGEWLYRYVAGIDVDLRARLSPYRRYAPARWRADARARRLPVRRRHCGKRLAPRRQHVATDGDDPGEYVGHSLRAGPT